MDADLSTAYAIAQAMIAGKTLRELTRLQIVLQTISSLVSAEIGCKRLSDQSQSQSSAGK